MAANSGSRFKLQPLNLSDEDLEILNEFITEGLESIEEIEPVLVELEENAQDLQEIDPGLINKIFRVFHSIKGSAGFIGLTLTSEVTHHAETLLDLIRKDKIQLRPEHIDIFLELCDFFRNLFNSIAENQNEEGFQDLAANFVDRLEALIGGDERESSQPATASSGEVDSGSASTASAAEENEPFMSLEDLISPEMITQFVQDSRELLETLEADLLALEKNPHEMELVESAFRALHSLKGNAGFFGFKDISSLCHKAESFLDDVRNHKKEPGPDQIGIILQMRDFLVTAVDNIAAGHSAEIAGAAGLIDLMEETFQEARDVSGAEDDEEKKEKQPAVTTTPAIEEPEQTSEKSEVNKEAVLKEKEETPISKPAASKPALAAKAKGNNDVIRVDVNRLNQLMDLVGEIVIAESMVAQHPEIAGRDLPGFEKAILHLQKNIRELQELSTSMRMIPLNGLFRKMIRLVRDLSTKSGKRVELEINGGDTEVDRSVIEHISDPLVHIIRNAVDHGIESAEERKAANKPAVGKIWLEAKQVGGEIWISIREDGRGLDRDKILKKAREKGIIQHSGADMSDEDVFNLIFAPGFSTAEKVTDISGRGVGMDVVRKNVEKIRGKVDVTSVKGEGTEFILRIPLTTAIVDGMLLRVGESLYAIPILDIRESLKISEKQIVEMMDGQEVVKIRENLFPVVRIHELHHLKPNKTHLTEGILVLVESGGKSICIFADELIEQKQLVIKPLPDYLGEIEGVSGCAILGDGNICLIFDIASLIKLAEQNEKDKELTHA
ncbi:MAG: hypothetical protein Kow0037_01890 [Calditrichia bacterium]